jgi:hypothetical protein
MNLPSLEWKTRRIFQIFCWGMLLAGCTPKSDYSLDQTSFDAKTLKMVEERTGIVLPSGSHGLRIFYKGSRIDPSFVAKVEIPSSFEQAMTEQIEKRHNQEGVVTGSLAEKVDWWKPQSAILITKRQFSLDGNFVRVFFCNEKDRRILYLEWSQI